MRASPPIEISLNRYGWWHAAVAALVGATAAAVSAWLLAAAAQRSGWEVALVVACASIAIVLAASTARTSPVVLRWDGATWRVAQGAGAGTAQRVLEGALQVSIDLGPWMLLRFSAASQGRVPIVVWLPVQRTGLEASWHALRCAVHARAQGEAR
jgi:hypothetical protein